MIKKLEEEIEEIKTGKNIEELADLIEAVYALGELIGAKPEDIEKTRLKKQQTNGAFSKRLILENNTK